MANNGPKRGFAFIIDTNSYSGSFEREMTAYLTGRIGECGVGVEYADFALPINFDNVIDVPDDHGCYRPTSIWLNEKNKYNSVAIFFEEQPTVDQIEFMKGRAYDFNIVSNNKIKILGFRLIEFISEIKEIKI
jgi:hypothetical protein